MHTEEAYFKCIDINKASLSKRQVSFDGPMALSVLVFGNQNMVTLVYIRYIS